jgi:hypothetical protein
MVARPKKPTHRPRVTMHQLAAMLETMRGESRAVGDTVHRLEARLETFQEEVDARFRQVDARFDTVDARFDRVDSRFDGVDSRFDGVDARFDGVDTRLGRVEHDIVLLKDAVIENTRELKHLRVVVDKKVDRDEIEPIVEGILRRRR